MCLRNKLQFNREEWILAGFNCWSCFRYHSLFLKSRDLLILQALPDWCYLKLWHSGSMFIKVNVLNVVLISSAITIVIWCILFHCSFSGTVSLALPTKKAPFCRDKIRLWGKSNTRLCWSLKRNYVFKTWPWLGFETLFWLSPLTLAGPKFNLWYSKDQFFFPLK